MTSQLRYVVCVVAAAVACSSCAKSDPPPPMAVPVGQPTRVVVAQTNPAKALSWPRAFVEGGTGIAVYQPQIETWEGTKLEARAAVAITPQGAKGPTLGVIWMEATTDVDKPSRIV